MSGKVVIVGAGFAGLTVAKKLGNSSFEVTILDRSNHHLFQPLLYQVATAMLSPADIAVPVRHVLSQYMNINVKMLEVTGVDILGKRVLCGGESESFDTLVIATGAQNFYFGNPWEKVAPSLKTLDDARAIRKRILTAMERAELEKNSSRRAELLTFVIIGGGPTGVEMAGAIAELTHQTVVGDFRVAEAERARVVIIEAGDRLLSTFSEESSREAQRALEHLGVEVRVKARVSDISEGVVRLGDEVIAAGAVIWAAGVRATPAAAWLGVPADRAGRVVVDAHLNLAGQKSIYVVGDVAAVTGSDGKPLPGVAPVAMQEGRYVARRILGETTEPFRYRDKGSLATIGRRAAVAEMGSLKLRGFIAWVTWTVVHIYYLIGFRNRVVVLMEWAWAYFTRQRGARLISPET
ncbi:MAG: NAD(P)/FAD-dependent oxidoreductase [Deltaproteobacteria bacterium]|nr:NAD(P)/FAD-dependent oxidoreductase [Deltaproteobacteria bacterium]MBI3294657.1 NAD(P)/FAD-dependent oxidoreductase [Deltaproteobacteria bacterium]